MADSIIDSDIKPDTLVAANFGVSGLSSTPASDTAPYGWGTPTVDGFGNPINPPLGTIGGPKPEVLLTKNVTTNVVRLSRHRSIGFQNAPGRVIYISPDEKLTLVGVQSYKWATFPATTAYEVKGGIYYKGKLIWAQFGLLAIGTYKVGGKTKIWAISCEAVEAGPALRRWIGSTTMTFNGTGLVSEVSVQGTYSRDDVPALPSPYASLLLHFDSAAISADCSECVVTLAGAGSSDNAEDASLLLSNGEGGQLPTVHSGGYIRFANRTLTSPEIHQNPMAETTGTEFVIDAYYDVNTLKFGKLTITGSGTVGTVTTVTTEYNSGNGDTFTATLASDSNPSPHVTTYSGTPMNCLLYRDPKNRVYLYWTLSGTGGVSAYTFRKDGTDYALSGLGQNYIGATTTTYLNFWRQAFFQQKTGTGANIPQNTVNWSKGKGGVWAASIPIFPSLATTTPPLGFDRPWASTTTYANFWSEQTAHGDIATYYGVAGANPVIRRLCAY